MQINKENVKLGWSFKERICVISIYALFFLNAIFNVQSKYLWNDESFTNQIISHSYMEIVHLTSMDVHPFLYYWIVKFFSMFSSDFNIRIVIFRIVSLLPYLLLLLIGQTLISKKFSKQVAILFMFSIVTMPNVIQNGYQVRMYSWSLFFVSLFFLNGFYFLFDDNSFKTVVTSSFFALCAAYSHYYGLISVAVIYFLILILLILKKRSIKNILLSIGMDVVFYIPWIFVLIKQTSTVSKGYWTPKLTLKSVLKLFLDNFTWINNKWGYLLVAIFFVLLLILFLRNTNSFNKEFVCLSICSLIVLIIGGVILSLIVGHTVIIFRYTVIVMGIVWLGIGVLIGTNLDNIFGKIAFILLFLTGIGSYVQYMRNCYGVSSEFNQTLQTFNRIPKNSHIYYDNSVVMFSSASYLEHNIVLSERKNDVLFTEYKKVFSNIGESNGLPKLASTNTYFIRAGQGARRSLYMYNSKLANKFFFEHHWKEVSVINLPSDGGQSILYKLVK